MLNILKKFNQKILLFLFILNLSLVTNLFTMDLTSLTCSNEMFWGNPEADFGAMGYDDANDSGMNFLAMAGLTIGAGAVCATGLCLRALSNALDDRTGSLPEEFEREEFPGQDELKDKNLKSLDDNFLNLGDPELKFTKESLDGETYATFRPTDLAKKYANSPRLVTELVFKKPVNTGLKPRDDDNFNFEAIRKNPDTSLGFLRDQKIKQRCTAHGINFRDCPTCNSGI